MGDAAAELALVRKAILSGLSGCCEWINDKTALRVQSDPELQGLTALGIKQLLRDWVAQGGLIQQKAERRFPYVYRREFWYYATIPVEGFAHGVFVELELFDDDPDYPCVHLLNAHPKKA